MAHLPNTQLPNVRPSDDGKWLRCPLCDDAYWGAFRPTDFIVGKLNAHLERKHKQQEAGSDEPAAAPAPAPKAQRPAAKARNAKLAAKAKAKGDGVVRIVREAPNTADLLGDAMADLLNDFGFELDPRLQFGQGPRDFPEDGRDAPRRAFRNRQQRAA